MRLVEVDPEDAVRVRAAADLLDAARVVDDPDAFELTAAELERDLRFGYDLEPPTLYSLERAPGSPAGLLQVDVPQRDNRHLVFAEITVHPDLRRQGHGSRLVDELVDLAGRLGRNTLWTRAAADDQAAAQFLTDRSFAPATADARRHQVLADVDPAEIDRLEQVARDRAGDYELVRLDPPLSDDVLTALLRAASAINDAPMGNLDFEEEVYDLYRMRDAQLAEERRGNVVYRVAARHRTTGEIGGHSKVIVHPETPEHAHQGDTAVAKAHRGHRLGLALKIEMMRWLAEAEPQITIIETWNNANNRFMIDVNEALGYRLSGVFATYQRVLD